MEKHPRLADKFKLLYLLKFNPKIKTNAELAKQLNMSKAAITKWCRGSPTSRGDVIPRDHILNVANLFFIDPQWLSLPYSEFEEKVRKKFSQENQKPRQKVRISTGTLPITDLNLYGRTNELKLLDKLWNDANVNIVEIVAFGGAGKSALVNKWLSDLSKSNYRGAQNVYAWSFYWQSQSTDVRSAGDYFIEHALEWFGDEDPRAGTPWSKALRLANFISRSKTLLVLDGIEILQKPPGERNGQIISISLSLLLKELAAENSGLCVITSRYSVADLAAFRDGRAYSIALSRLDQMAGIEMLHASGLKGSNHQFLEAVEAYEGHALSLSLLVGFLSIAHSGELSKIVYMNSVLEEQQNKIHVERIMGDYILWLENKPHMQLLTLICLLERTCNLDEVSFYIGFEEISGLNDKLGKLSYNGLRYAIKDLDDANLISTSIIGNQLEIDCHPLVRDFVLERLNRNSKDLYEQAHGLVFEALISRISENRNSNNDIESFFRAVIHGAKAKQYQKAFEIYYERIKKGQFLLFAEGSHYADQACLSGFFDQDWNIRSTELKEDAQVYLLTSAATNLMNLGNINQAIVLSRRCIDWFVENERWLEAAIAAAPLMSMLIASGKLGSAKLLLNELSDVVKLANNMVVTAGAQNFRAYVAYLGGDIEEARSRFDRSEKILTELIPKSPAPFPTISAFYCKFLLETGLKWKALERSLKTFAWRKSKAWQVAFDTTPLLTWDMLVLGLIFLEIGDKINAEKVMDEQVDLLRKAEEWLYLPTGLTSRARMHAKLGNYQNAIEDLDESLEISRQMGIRFGEWETCIEFANLYLILDDQKNCKKYLRMAEKIPEMHHYKFRDAEIAQLKSNIALH